MVDYLMDVNRIMEIMPHRYPFLLIDRILELQVGKSIKGLKNVTLNEHFFQGHFPGRPVMPGVLIIEAMAQCGGILAYMDTEAGITPGSLIFVSSFENAKFRQPVVPGDQLIIDLIQLRRGSRLLKMSAQGLVDGRVVASTEMTAVVVNSASNGQ